MVWRTLAFLACMAVAASGKCVLNALVYATSVQPHSYNTTLENVGNALDCTINITDSATDTEFFAAAAFGDTQIFIVNPTLRTCLADSYAIVQLGSVVTSVDDVPTPLLAGLMIARADRTDLASATDADWLSGKRIGVSAYPSLSGLLLPVLELRRHGFDTLTRANVLARPSPYVTVTDVLTGVVDVGFIPSTILNQTQLLPFKLLFPRKYPQYPIPVSTILSPSTSMIALTGVLGPQFEKTITETLFGLNSTSEEAVLGGFDSWVDPLSMTVVVDALKALNVVTDENVCRNSTTFDELVQCPVGSHRVAIDSGCSAVGGPFAAACLEANTSCVCGPCMQNPAPLAWYLIMLSALLPLLALAALATWLYVRWRRSRPDQFDKLNYLTGVAARVFPGREVKVLEWIGSGSFGEVYRGTFDGAEVAIKITRCDSESTNLANIPAKPVSHEGLVPAGFDHPNVVKTLCYGVVQQSSASAPTRSVSTTRQLDDLWLVLEFCDGGSLKDKLMSGLLGVDVLGVDAASGALLGIARGMQYMHEKGCIHGDLNSNNILLQSGSEPFVCKVCDFGLMRTTADWTKTFKSTMAFGTLTHMAPELLRDGQLSPQVDVYAFGLLAWEVLHGQSAFSDKPAALISTLVMQGDRPEIRADLPAYLKDVIGSCWVQSSHKRPTWTAVINGLEKGLADSRTVPQN